MNRPRPFVDPNDSYSYEDWMNDQATYVPSADDMREETSECT